jgi:hypothetical protein
MPTLAEKLHPKRYPGMSGRMAAIVGYILGEEWSNPLIAELVITSDAWLLARDEGQVTFDTIVGTAADLERNWLALLDVAGLTSEERAEVERLYGKAVRDYRRQPEKVV